MMPYPTVVIIIITIVNIIIAVISNPPESRPSQLYIYILGAGAGNRNSEFGDRTSDSNMKIQWAWLRTPRLCNNHATV